MKLRSGVSTTTKTSGSLGKRCWRKGGKGGSSPKQLRQHGTSTCNSTGTRAATRNSTPSGTSGASTSAGPTGTTNSRGPRHLRQPRRRRPRYVESCPCGRRGPTSSPQNDSDDDDDDDEEDIDLNINNKVAEILVKEQKRLAQRRAIRARYRARYPERVAEQRRRSQARYRAKYPERLAEQRRRYRAKNRDRLAEQSRLYRERCRAYMKQYYKDRAEQLRSTKGIFTDRKQVNGGRNNT